MKFLEGKKTYLGIFIAVLPTIANLFGYTITIDASTEANVILSALADNVEGVIVGLGALFAWYGRAVTKG